MSCEQYQMSKLKHSEVKVCHVLTFKCECIWTVNSNSETWQKEIISLTGQFCIPCDQVLRAFNLQVKSSGSQQCFGCIVPCDGLPWHNQCNISSASCLHGENSEFCLLPKVLSNHSLPYFFAEFVSFHICVSASPRSLTWYIPWMRCSYG